MKQEPIKIPQMLEEIEACTDLGNPIPLEHAMAEAIDTSVKAALKAGKKAVVNVQIVIDPAGETVNMSATVTRKDPKIKARATKLFVDVRGRLFHDDPKQEVFDIDTSETPAAAHGG